MLFFHLRTISFKKLHSIDQADQMHLHFKSLPVLLIGNGIKGEQLKIIWLDLVGVKWAL